MIAKKYSLLIICLSLYQLVPAQDGKLSWYYPNLGDVDPRTTVKKGSYILNSHGISGCVSGNCQTGSGEYLIAYPAHDTVMKTSDVNQVVNLRLYKGQFSNNGKNFEGTVYARRVYYDVEFNKKYEPKLIPRIKEDLKKEAFWKPGEVASGSMEKYGDPVDYQWNGWMERAHNPTIQIQPGHESSFRAHFTRDEAHVKIQYTPGGTYTQIEGRSLKNGELLGGRILFSDGSKYEGFVHKGRRFGPGRFTSKEGKTEEGIWMLDSLAIATAVTIPNDLIEPGKKTATIGSFEYDGYKSLEFKDAGNGWVYAFYTNILFLGKMEGGKLNGPGFGYSDVFLAGMFKEGRLVSGMKIREDSYFTTVITGEFKDNQIKPSCAKMLRYDTKGKLVYMAEGYFYPNSNDKKREFADGWAYINDWEGKRQAANLQYLYSGEDYLAMNGDPTYVSWFTRGLQESGPAVFCFPSMKAQAAPILALMKQRHDSVVVYANKRAADIAAYKKEWADREARNTAACATEQAKYKYAAGDLYQIGDAYDPPKFLITGTLDCYKKAFLVYKRHWVQTTPKIGYWNVATVYLTDEEIKKAKKIGTNHGVCGKCGGRGSIPVTEYHEVGGNSGYTSVGGGWMIKNPETYWKSESWRLCKDCSGTGFIK